MSQSEPTLDEIVAKVQKIRDELPPDSPLRSVTFKMLALAGEIEATLKAANNA